MPTPIYDKPDYSNGIWAYAGTRIVPSNDKVAEGHVVERPPYEISNYLENRQDQGIAYLLQNGIANWDSVTTYPANAFVKKDGFVYRAISQNTNIDPASNSTIWTRAFYSYSDGYDLASQVNNIRNTDGYLTLYVQKSAPVLNGRAWGYGYLAQTGLPATGEENIGYAFRNNGGDGIFHDGSVAVAVNNGSIVARFQTPAAITETTKNVVTMDILNQALAAHQSYKVGDVYITTATEDPATRWGYGTWERFAQGRTLVGYSENGSDPNWTRTIMNTFGEYSVMLTADNAPPHTHFAIKDQYGGESDLNATYNIATSAHRVESDYKGYILGGTTNKIPDRARTSNPIGTNGAPITESTPHNNVQPSVVVYFWRRTA